MKTSERDPQTLELIHQARIYQGTPPEQYFVNLTSLSQLLDSQAQAQGAKPYLIYYNDETSEHSKISYAGFVTRVRRIASLLANDLGVQRGERVATMAHNHPDTVELYWACWMIGATVAPQNISEDDQRIAFILGNAEVRVLFARPEYLDRVERIRQDAPEVTTVITFGADLEQRLLDQPGDFRPTEQATLDDEALLVYTSGTTGAPKGVQLTQYNLIADALGISRWHRIDDDTKMMCILPIHHVNGIEVTLITPFLVGATTVLNRGFSASSFWKRIAEERVNIVSVVPTILQYLCEAGEDISTYDLSRFRYPICGAGTLAVALVTRFEEQFGIPILHGYGLSETTCYSCFLPVDLGQEEHRRWMAEYGYPSIGVPIFPNEMQIHDPEGNPLPDHQHGEIVIRGHNVMVGYFNRPDANAETFKHGWFRSGDEGFVVHDEQGRAFFFITGRLKELINRGGVKYSPFEIEEVLLAIPGVKVGLAIAFDNTWYGEEVGAYIVPEEGAQLTEEEVLRFCRERMPFAKCPKAVVFGTEIPVTTTGKYQRLKLKDRFEQWAETQFRG